MKTIGYPSAALECARYIFDSQSEQESYQEFIQDGNDPRDHILYYAAVVLNETDDFQPDIDDYLHMEND
jgi:hypothetical protein